MPSLSEMINQMLAAQKLGQSTGTGEFTDPSLWASQPAPTAIPTAAPQPQKPPTQIGDAWSWTAEPDPNVSTTAAPPENGATQMQASFGPSGTPSLTGWAGGAFPAGNSQAPGQGAGGGDDSSMWWDKQAPWWDQGLTFVKERARHGAPMSMPNININMQQSQWQQQWMEQGQCPEHPEAPPHECPAPEQPPPPPEQEQPPPWIPPEIPPPEIPPEIPPPRIPPEKPPEIPPEIPPEQPPPPPDGEFPGGWPPITNVPDGGLTPGGGPAPTGGGVTPGGGLAPGGGLTPGGMDWSAWAPGGPQWNFPKGSGISFPPSGGSGAPAGAAPAPGAPGAMPTFPGMPLGMGGLGGITPTTPMTPMGAAPWLPANADGTPLTYDQLAQASAAGYGSSQPAASSNGNPPSNFPSHPNIFGKGDRTIDRLQGYTPVGGKGHVVRSNRNPPGTKPAGWAGNNPDRGPYTPGAGANAWGNYQPPGGGIAPTAPTPPWSNDQERDAILAAGGSDFYNPDGTLNARGMDAQANGQLEAAVNARRSAAGGLPPLDIDGSGQIDTVRGQPSGPPGGVGGSTPMGAAPWLPANADGTPLTYDQLAQASAAGYGSSQPKSSMGAWANDQERDTFLAAGGNEIYNPDGSLTPAGQNAQQGKFLEQKVNKIRSNVGLPPVDVDGDGKAIGGAPVAASGQPLTNASGWDPLAKAGVSADSFTGPKFDAFPGWAGPKGGAARQPFNPNVPAAFANTSPVAAPPASGPGIGRGSSSTPYSRSSGLLDTNAPGASKNPNAPTGAGSSAGGGGSGYTPPTTDTSLSRTLGALRNMPGGGGTTNIFNSAPSAPAAAAPRPATPRTPRPATPQAAAPRPSTPAPTTPRPAAPKPAAPKPTTTYTPPRSSSVSTAYRPTTSYASAYRPTLSAFSSYAPTYASSYRAPTSYASTYKAPATTYKAPTYSSSSSSSYKPSTSSSSSSSSSYKPPTTSSSVKTSYTPVKTSTPAKVTVAAIKPKVTASTLKTATKITAKPTSSSTANWGKLLQ